MQRSGDGHLPRRGEDDEDGFTLIELVIAVTLLSVVAVGFATSIGLGFRTIAMARQRQTAAEIASARLEHLRSIPYTEVALSSQPARSADPGNPDWYVSSDGTQYDVTGAGSPETLVVASGTGAVLHLEDPVQVGSTVMEIYQYVTWVDDPAVAGTQDYRRVTVGVRYKTPSVNGVSRIVRASSLFTTGTVTVTAVSTTTTTSPPATTTTTTPATTTTTSAGLCPGDTTPPSGSFTVGAGAGAEVGFAPVPNVTLTMSLTDPCTPMVARFSNDGTSFGADLTYDPANPSISWALTSGDGAKEVSARARDARGNEASLAPQSIVLDTVRPTVPGTLTRTVSCAGSNRTVTLTWGASSDVNLRGYRVYRSTDGTTWSALKTVAVSPTTDTHAKTLDSVRYYLVGYDKAGNESDATNTISLAKNQCS